MTSPRVRGRNRQQLFIDVVEAIAVATADGRGGIFGQQALADEVQCSAATLTAEMPNVVAKSRELYPGYCVELGIVERHGRAAVYRYRIVNEQSLGEMKETQRRTRKAETAIRRAVHEMDIANAPPGAQAAVGIIEAGVDTIVRGLRLFEEAMIEV